MREGHLCTTFKMYANSFSRQRAWLEALMKVTSKAHRWRREEKVLQKIDFFCIVFNN